jgi:hypothetical protein
VLRPEPLRDVVTSGRKQCRARLHTPSALAYLSQATQIAVVRSGMPYNMKIQRSSHSNIPAMARFRVAPICRRQPSRPRSCIPPIIYRRSLAWAKEVCPPPKTSNSCTVDLTQSDTSLLCVESRPGIAFNRTGSKQNTAVSCVAPYLTEDPSSAWRRARAARWLSSVSIRAAGQ